MNLKVFQNTVYLDTTEAILRRKFVVINAHIKKKKDPQ
jgi:hypothetical protein